MNYSMRMLDSHRRQMRDLLADTTREQACFLICSVAHGGSGTFLLVREVQAIAQADLLIHAPDQLSVSPSAMLGAARRAERLGGCVCMVHTHPMSHGSVDFSRADDAGNERSFEFFHRLLPGMPHSCLVWDGKLECAAGRVYASATEWSTLADISVVSGDRRERVRPILSPDDVAHADRFARQALLLGHEGQARLSEMTIVIVGCGGIGSVVVTVLVHSGVRRFVLVDFDRVEHTNLPRIIAATPRDADARRYKVDVMRDYIVSHAPDATVETMKLPVEDPQLLSGLVDADLVVCATDDTTSRAFLNQLDHQYYVPVLDLGVQFAADKITGALVKEVGKINLVLPGTPCLSCTGDVNPRRLAQEGATHEQFDALVRDGYVDGVDVPEPAMMVFNMQVAALGVQRIIEWSTGLVPVSTDTIDTYRFLGLAGEPGIKQRRKRSDPACPFCGDDPDFLGSGDRDPMLVRPRPRTSAEARREKEEA